MNRIDKFQGKKIIGWKKAVRITKSGTRFHVLIKLEINARTRRVQPRDRKCRAASARVLEIVSLPSKISYRGAVVEVGGRKLKYAFASKGFFCGERFRYGVGQIVKPKKKYDPDPAHECRSGIHFFLTEQEAREYYL